MKQNSLHICILLAFALQALMPHGFMPSFKGGEVSIVICTAQGEKTIILDGDNNPVKDHQHNKSHSDCIYGISQSASLNHAYDLNFQSFIFEHNHYYVQASQISYINQTKTHHSRAPPFLFVA